MKSKFMMSFWRKSTVLMSPVKIKLTTVLPKVSKSNQGKFNIVVSEGTNSRALTCYFVFQFSPTKGSKGP
jgi:hypothetical protein